MGRDLNSRPPVCETGIITSLDHPSQILLIFSQLISWWIIDRGKSLTGICKVKLKSFLEKKGGKLDDILYTFGKYDAVITAELPSDELAMSVSLSTGALGNVRITTLKAFSLDETKKIIDSLK